MRRFACTLLAMLAVAPAAAWADAEEASLVLEGGLAVFRAVTPVFSSASTTRPGGAGGLRLSYGFTDLLAAEVSLGTAIAEAVEYPDQVSEEDGRGITHYDLRVLRTTVGATARFGARWIPTATVAIGYQHRFMTGGAFIEEQRNLIASLPGRGADDMLVLVGGGLEYRLGRHLIVGVSAQLVHAFPVNGPGFDAIEVPIRVSYSFYPGWFRPQYTERLDD